MSKAPPLNGCIDPLDLNQTLPKYFLMHSYVYNWLTRNVEFVWDGRIYQVPVVIDDREPEFTSWAEIFKASNEAKFIPLRFIKETYSTEELLDVLKTRGYKVILER